MRRRRRKALADELADAGSEKRVLFENVRPSQGRAPRRGPSLSAYPLVWGRKHLPSGRQGRACRKVAPSMRGNGMATIEFTDGARFVVDPGGLQKRAATTNGGT